MIKKMALNEKNVKENLGRKDRNVHYELNHEIIEMLELNSASSSDHSDETDEDEVDPFDDKDKGIQHKALALYQAQQATNREAFGTWNRPLDFTLTLVGYIIGIHNFFRFPHLCYKYGTLTFLIPYTIMMIVIGIPSIFMECTIGQYYGVGSITAFRHLAPIITGVSYILAWNSFINCWMYGIMITWMRTYSGDSLSCLKGWVGCHEDHYYNTPYCWTGILDQCCTNPELEEFESKCPFPKTSSLGNDSIYFNYKCTKTEEFCGMLGWTYIPGTKECIDAQNKTHPIYKRRFHATYEYFYGYVMGMKKSMARKKTGSREGGCGVARTGQCKKEAVEVSEKSAEEAVKVSEKSVSAEEVSDRSTTVSEKSVKKADEVSEKSVEEPVDVSEKSVEGTDKVSVKSYEEAVKVSEKLVEEAEEYWSQEGQRLLVNPESSSFIQLPTFAFTTCLLITFFLFDNLLSVSSMTYILNGIPFLLLLYLTFLALQFRNASRGIEDFLSIRGIEELFGMDIWIESIVQVLVTTGVGNGALISLASFNKYHHRFLVDLLFVSGLNMITSILATVICFCTIGHYLMEYEISVAFEEFIHLESNYSSVEFAYIVYSHYLTQINEYEISTLLFFFMISSFPTDTAIRLAQNVLDATVQVLPRLRFHSTMALLGVSVFYLLSLLPVTRNGGIILFMEYEYFALYFAIPIITIIEVISVGWVYRASRVMDNAQQLGVVSHHIFRKYFTICFKYATPLLLLLVLFSNLREQKERFRSVKSGNSEFFTACFGCLFCLTPVLLFLLSILKQLAAFPKRKWKDLLQPTARHLIHRTGLGRKLRTRFSQRKQHYMHREELLLDEDDRVNDTVTKNTQNNSKNNDTATQEIEVTWKANQGGQITRRSKEERQTIQRSGEEEPQMLNEEGRVIQRSKEEPWRSTKGQAIERSEGGEQTVRTSKEDEPRRSKEEEEPAESWRKFGEEERDREGQIIRRSKVGQRSKPEGKVTRRSKEGEVKEIDGVSIDSRELNDLKSYIFWHGIMTYLEDWPDRLDDTEVESMGSSVSSSDQEDHLYR